jgi:hypothetical protein
MMITPQMKITISLLPPPKSILVYWVSEIWRLAGLFCSDGDNNLSQEWSSLPLPSPDSISFY